MWARYRRTAPNTLDYRSAGQRFTIRCPLWVINRSSSIEKHDIRPWSLSTNNISPSFLPWFTSISHRYTPTPRHVSYYNSAVFVARSPHWWYLGTLSIMLEFMMFTGVVIYVTNHIHVERVIMRRYRLSAEWPFTTENYPGSN